MPAKLAITAPDAGIPLEAVRRVLDRVDAETVDVTPEPASLPPAIRVMIRAREGVRGYPS